MDKKFPEQWMRDPAATPEQIERKRHDVQRMVKQSADGICKRRKAEAESLKQEVAIIDGKITQLNDIIQKVRESLPVEKNPAVRKSIEESCNDILNKCYDYKDKLDTLQRRFANQRIRILSFGNKSQGKSTFTKAYTHLPDKIVGTKKRGNNDDKTGATSVIIHTKGIDANNPLIRVIFKTPERILKMVNYCFEKLHIGERYNSWPELYAVLSDSERKSQLYDRVEKYEQPKDKEKKIDGFASFKEILTSVFNNSSNFEDVNSGKKEYFDIEKGKEITVDDLPKYNDMGNEGCQCYTSVSEIHIYADLEHEDMFENFEICDTKGMSIEAGGALWEEELFEIMGNSDAVFSIQMTGNPAVGPLDLLFYDNLNTAIFKKGELLDDMDLKHFAIINVFKHPDDENVKMPTELVTKLERMGIANTAYVGALTAGVRYDDKELDLQDFVEYIIHHMMGEIVKTTEETDDKLVKACKQSISHIKQKINELENLLSAYEKITPKEKEDIYRDAIRQWLIKEGCPNVRNQLKEIARNEHLQLNHFQESDNGNYGNNTSQKSNDKRKSYNPWDRDNTSNNDLEKKEEKEEIQYKAQQADETEQNEALYQMITGNVCNLKDLKGKGEDDIVKKAISALYESLKPRIGTREGEQWTEMGCVHNIGAYIDSVAYLMRNQIMNNINYVFAPSKDIPGSQDFKDMVFKKVWDVLKLDVVYQEFDGVLLRKNKDDERLENERLDKWSIGYNEVKQDGFSTPIEGCPSFIILKEYFDAVQPLNKQEFGSMLDSYDYIIDESKLVEALQKAYLKYDLAERCKEKQSEVLGWKTKLVHFLKADVNHGEFISQMIDLYKYTCPDNYVHKLTEAGILDKSIEEDWVNQKRIAELKNQRKNLSGFSF